VRVGLFITCFNDTLLPQVGRATVEVLERQGVAIDLPRSQTCCGFGGTFAVNNPDTSTAMGDDKVRDMLEAGAPVLTAADTSCLLHLDGLLSRLGAGVPLHAAVILGAVQPAREGRSVQRRACGILARA
jgi:L-lactate dehydrogenase complex protein LldE